MDTGWTCELKHTLMKRAIWWMAVLLFFLTPEPSWARGGGGCLAEGTRVLTPEGPVSVEKLKEGDAVLSVIDGKFRKARVQALIKVQPEEYLEFSAGDASLVVTPEHPMMVSVS